MNNQEQDPLKAPIAVGTYYYEASGNSTIHYTIGCVHLRMNDAGDAVITPDGYYSVVIDEGNGPVTKYVAKYSYQYTGTNPTAMDSVKSYVLPPFVPQQDSQGNEIHPDFVMVYNVDDQSQTKAGKINKTNPKKIFFEDNDDIVNQMYYPRLQVMKDVPNNGGANPPEFYSVFIIAKTQNPQNKFLSPLISGTTITASPDLNNQGPPDDLVAAVTLVPQAAGAANFTNVICLGNSNSPDYTDFKLFTFDPATLPPGS